MEGQQVATQLILVITGSSDISDDLKLAINARFSEFGVQKPTCQRLGDSALEFELTDQLNRASDEVLGTLKDNFIDAKLDFNLVPKKGRKKKLLLADMDSTLIKNECIDELASYKGIEDKISRITSKAMAGELDFIISFKERVALLKGLSESVLQRTYDEKIMLNPGAAVLGQTLAKHGVETVIVSGGFEFFTQRVADAIGFQSNISNFLEIKEGLLTGFVKEPIMGPEAKKAILDAQCDSLQINHIQTMCVGDGANDIPMITAAGLGVAYHAKPTVESHADVSIKHADLTALLYLQGYYQSEFIGI